MSVSPHPDGRLVALCRSGDDAAFEEIVRRHRAALERYCRGIVGPDQSEDVVQQALMSAYLALRSGDDRELALKPWLYRVTRNAALDALRVERRRRDELDDDVLDAPPPAQVLESRQRVRDVVAAVGALPERQRDALVMQTFHGLSYRAIARSMGEDVPVVRQLIHRARGRVRSACAALVPLPLLRLLARSGDRLPLPAGAASDAVPLKLAALTAVAAIGAGVSTNGALRSDRSAERAVRPPQLAAAPRAEAPVVLATARRGARTTRPASRRTHHSVARLATPRADVAAGRAGSVAVATVPPPTRQSTAPASSPAPPNTGGHPTISTAASDVTVALDRATAEASAGVRRIAAGAQASVGTIRATLDGIIP